MQPVGQLQENYLWLGESTVLQWSFMTKRKTGSKMFFSIFHTLCEFKEDLFKKTIIISPGRWYNASDLLAEIDFRDSVVYNGKLYVAGIQSPAVTSSLWSGQCYEAETDTWRFMKPTMVEGWKGPSVELDGKLFGVEWNQGIRISCYDDLSGRWKRLGRIPDNVLSPPLSLCGLLGKLYVVGRGGCMLEIKTKELGQRTSLNPMLARKIEGIGGKEYTVVGCYVVWA